MGGPPVALDAVIMIALCAVMPALEAAWFYPRFRRAVAAARPGARARYYAATIVVLWAFTGAVLGMWAVYRRPWAALSLRPARSLGVWLGLGLSVLYVLATWWQMRALLRRPDGRPMLRRAMAGASALLPSTRGTRRAFVFVALTAGICEEVLFRGYVTWYCAAWTGPIVAVALSAVLFGIGHVYLGGSHVVKAGLLGLVMSGVVIAGGALWPAIVLHAVIDLVAGEVGYRGLSGSDPGTIHGDTA
jgi:membrane protease YdiL (CAAX protease family)